MEEELCLTRENCYLPLSSQISHCYLAIIGQLGVALLQLQLQDAGSHEGEATKETAGDDSLQRRLQDTELPLGDVRGESMEIFGSFNQPSRG